MLQSVAVGWVGPGGFVWQLVPQASKLPFTVVHTGADLVLPPGFGPARVPPWQ